MRSLSSNCGGFDEKKNSNQIPTRTAKKDRPIRLASCIHLMQEMMESIRTSVLVKMSINK